MDEKKKDIALAPLPIKKEISESEKPSKVTNLEEVFRIMKDTLQMQIQFQSDRAAINKATYDSMIAVGFSKEEAMQFIIAKGI